MQTETASNQTDWTFARARRSMLARLFGLRLVWVMGIAVLVALLAYQVPPTAEVRVGWFGDRLFVPASAGLGASEAEAGRWFGDELTGDSPTQRSRWTRSRAVVNFPNFGARNGAELTVLAQGWPQDAVREAAQPSQPTIHVFANGMLIGSFEPTGAWAEQRLTIPAEVLHGADLVIELSSDQSFTDTATTTDIRPKVLRVARVQVVANGTGGLALPPLQPTLLLVFAGMATYLALDRRLRRPTFALAGALLALAVLGLALALVRAWAGALLPWAVGASVVVLALAYAGNVRALLADAVRRSERTGAIGMGITAALVAGAAYLVVRAIVAADVFTLVLLVALAVSLLLAWVPTAVRGAAALAAWLNTRHAAVLILSTFLVMWLGYEAWIVFTIPGAGHADYSDNAVVARNLVSGRGWVVDYVTQFYRLYPSLTRPQETWPLLQPVWIAPFFLLFGATDWAAKLPNLIFSAVLGVLIYRFGSRVWDRRIGLTAAILLLTSYLFFLLVINVTSDLGFVVLSFAVIGLVYWWSMDGGRWSMGGSVKHRPPSTVHRLPSLLGLGLLTGLMMLQKPANGVFVAAGCGIWLLWQLCQRPTTDNRRPTIQVFIRRLAPVAVWTAVALAIFMPYIVRNIMLSAQNDHLYGTLVYSTESRDAWVWGYAPDSDYIYQIYTPQAGLSETQGLPDRSWILRWGFDRTFEKVGDQVEAVRDYLFPVWSNLPNGWSEIISGRDKRLFFAAGAWLSVLGLFSAIRSRTKLVSLLAWTFTPYIIFLALYWHADEERYFVALMPWLALLASLAIWRVYNWLAAVANGRLAPAALFTAVLLTIAIVAPSGPKIGQKLEEWHRADSDRVAYQWLRENTEPDEAVMTRVPWQLNWHAKRPALMIPMTQNPEKLLQLARFYNIRYLVFDVGQRPDAATQAMLQKMVDDESLGFTVEYTSPILYADKPTIVYRFPADYGGVPELRP